MDASSAPRGTKRKRPEPAKEDPARKLAGKLHHDLKDVRKAAKKARTFETQRLVKKLKGLRARLNASEPEIRTIEAELAELKTIDHDALAHTALRTRLLKDKRLAAAVLLDELTLHLAPSPATAKLHARLLSAKALAAGVQAAMDDLRAALLPKPGADAEEGQRPVKSTRVEGDGDGENEDEDEDEESEEDEEEDDDGDELAQPQDDTGWESGSVGDNDEDEDEDGDADGWESGSVDSNPAPAVKPSTTSKTAKSITVTKSTTVAKTTKTPVAAKPTASAPSLSTFLPSLAVGFVRGGSSDSDVDDADEVDVDPRKNRRGQRARRAIWEKKYGRNANHKKVEAEKEKERVAKAQARRGDQRVQGPDAGWGGRSKPGAAQRAPAAKRPPAVAAPAERGLHPSWEAKKRLKEKVGGAGGIVPSQGTKIKFT